ncbi:hypothetical protein QF031_001852 [Pseudarthrobacter defluvii]|nr:hypothetical protein [Pseudarthrobacter defluvii]
MKPVYGAWLDGGCGYALGEYDLPRVLFVPLPGDWRRFIPCATLPLGRRVKK